jgi:ectoine hydroxylase-related dioxygenase (phytanoyl-CoA dioxygenase family)
VKAAGARRSIDRARIAQLREPIVAALDRAPYVDRATFAAAFGDVARAQPAKAGGTSAVSVVTPEMVEAFIRDGYVVIPNLLSIEELDRLGQPVDDAVATLRAQDHRKLEEKGRYEKVFLQHINLWERFPAVRQLTFHPKIAHAAAELLQAAAVRLWHDQALFKEPGGLPTDPHQDQPYWTIKEPRTVTAWVPLDGADRTTGCLGYVAGSHQAGLRTFVDMFQDKPPEDVTKDPLLRGGRMRFVPVPKGSVAFHHGLTVHAAMPNLSDKMRRVHTMIYFADGCTMEPPRTKGPKVTHFCTDRPKIQVGQPIASDLTPIAWPRPDGDLPGTPTV